MPDRSENNMCKELETLKLEAAQVLRAVKRVRRSRDVSFYEDAELSRRKHRSLNAVLKHLLVGHEGKPCPAGDRPIVRPANTAYFRA
jgi:ParB-like chromosome segregation protein Spo0J